MSIELRPLGVKCNIQCQYCYQNALRDAGNVPNKYDLDLMKQAIEREGGGFTLFGGEPLLVPEGDLEHLWKWGLEKYGRNGIQTNGTLINDEHIRMFRDYKVHVGVSIDGPEDLNDVRWCGTLEKTRESTEKTQCAISRLCDEGMKPSIITTLHRINASCERLPRLHEWVRSLDSMGIRNMRLHVLESDSAEVDDHYALSDEENRRAFLSFLALEPELTHLRFDVFDDLRRLLLGRDKGTTCIWNGCDPYTTEAVKGIEGFGQTSNCGRTNKDGIDFVKAEEKGYERYVALYHTPESSNGCNGCRFFSMCKGQCPGTAVDGDWRNRTEHCAFWKMQFTSIESELMRAGRLPLTQSSLLSGIERQLVNAWSEGRNISISEAMTELMTDAVWAPKLHAFYEANQFTHSYASGRVKHLDHCDSLMNH